MADEQRSFKRLNFSSVVPGSLLQTLVIDAVCPYMIYPLLAERLSAPLALLLVALFPLGNILAHVSRRHYVDVVGVGTLFIITSILASLYLHGSAAPVLSCALPIGLLGIITLLSFLLPKPLFFFIDRYFNTHSNLEQAARYRTFWWDVREYRRMVKVMNAVWGIGQLLLALLLASLFFVLPSSLYRSLLPFAVFLPYAVLIVWMIQYRSSFERRWTMISQELHVESEEEKFLV
ncbi:MAG: hypothetical protein H0U76_29400 [Ktedonobacteraceae bacterium]|nr:hypothetical protein [Ktedonobacteraceae bacterium]